jgi:segregation and condensation protein B
MEEREWIRVVGYRDVPGRPALFGTTRAFLDYFNLKSLDELPPLSEIRDMEDPQMRIDQEPLPARVVRDLPIDPDEENETLVVASEEVEAVMEAPAGEAPQSIDDEEALEPSVTDATADEQPLAMEVAGIPSEPGDASHAEAPTDTADEAATRADADDGDATQDTKEYRA